MIVPNDCIALLASLSQKIEEDLHLAAESVKEDPRLAVPGIVEPVVRITENVDRIRSLLRIVVEEQPSATERTV